MKIMRLSCILQILLTFAFTCGGLKLSTGVPILGDECDLYVSIPGEVSVLIVKRKQILLLCLQLLCREGFKCVDEFSTYTN